MKYELMTPENRSMMFQVCLNLCLACYPGDPWATSHVYQEFFWRGPWTRR